MPPHTPLFLFPFPFSLSIWKYGMENREGGTGERILGFDGCTRWDEIWNRKYISKAERPPKAEKNWIRRLCKRRRRRTSSIQNFDIYRNFKISKKKNFSAPLLFFFLFSSKSSIQFDRSEQSDQNSLDNHNHELAPHPHLHPYSGNLKSEIWNLKFGLSVLVLVLV